MKKNIQEKERSELKTSTMSNFEDCDVIYVNIKENLKTMTDFKCIFCNDTWFKDIDSNKTVHRNTVIEKSFT